MKILVFDTETSGLPERSASIYEHSKWPYIIQLSYVLYDGGRTWPCTKCGHGPMSKPYLSGSPMTKSYRLILYMCTIYLH